MSELNPWKQPTLPSAETEQQRLRVLTTPLSLRGWPVWLIYLLAMLGMIYLLNPTFGIDFLPDNLPIIGNLDEGVAAMMLWYGLVEFFEGHHYHQTPNVEEGDWEEITPETTAE